MESMGWKKGFREEFEASIAGYFTTQNMPALLEFSVRAWDCARIGSSALAGRFTSFYSLSQLFGRKAGGFRKISVGSGGCSFRSGRSVLGSLRILRFDYRVVFPGARVLPVSRRYRF